MNTVIPAEIDRFNRLAETWWDEQGPMWPLHRLNALRVPYIDAQLRQHFQIDTQEPLALDVLDIGCGAGILSASMAKSGANVRGIDAAAQNIEIARQHALAGGLDIRYETLPVEALDASRQYDVILNMEVVEHVDDLPGFMRHCAQLVRPGGLMVVATINRTLYSLITAKLGAEYILGWLPKGTHTWRRFVKPDEAFGLLRDHGFALRDLTGVGINPIRRSMFLSTFLGANYMMTLVRNPLPRAGKKPHHS